MKSNLRILVAALALAVSVLVEAVETNATSQKVVCKDGVCYLVSEDGEPIKAVDNALPTDLAQLADKLGIASKSTDATAKVSSPRIAFGYMKEPEFLAFLRNESASASTSPFAGKSLPLVLLLAFLGGIALNLTPCVLPLVPVNVAIILKRGGGKSRGAGFACGLLYGLGMAVAYGALGLAAAFGGLAFGTLQSAWWFQLGAAAIFVALALALLDVFHLDLSRWRGKVTAAKGSGWWSLVVMGAVAALLAGACTAPVLVAVLIYASDAVAAGNLMAVSVPFALGLGMAAPWPLLGAGVSALPKPGAWMVWVKRAFAVFFLWLGLGVYGQMAIVQLCGCTVSEAFSPEAANETFKLAQAEKRPIFVKIGAPWCKNCGAMNRTTLKSEAVRGEFKARGLQQIPIEINEFSELAQYPFLHGLDIKGLPAYLIFE